MEPRYIRSIPALTREELDLLRQKQVLILGCGGIGGYLLDLLLRIGVGAIRVCDGDCFDQTNLNRQLLARLPVMGASKAGTAAAYAQQINPEVTLEAVDVPMTQDNVRELIRGCHVVLDALDNGKSRRTLFDACSQAGIPYVFGAVGGWVAQAAICMPGDTLIETLYAGQPDPGDKSVLSFTASVCAGIQASLCTRLLTGRSVETGRLYHCDLLNLELDTLFFE